MPVWIESNHVVTYRREHQRENYLKTEQIKGATNCKRD